MVLSGGLQRAGIQSGPEHSALISHWLGGFWKYAPRLCLRLFIRPQPLTARAVYLGLLGEVGPVPSISCGRPTAFRPRALLRGGRRLHSSFARTVRSRRFGLVRSVRLLAGRLAVYLNASCLVKGNTDSYPFVSHTHILHSLHFSPNFSPVYLLLSLWLFCNYFVMFYYVVVSALWLFVSFDFSSVHVGVNFALLYYPLFLHVMFLVVSVNFCSTFSSIYRNMCLDMIF